MAATSDDYAPEHLTVQAEDLDWWLGPAVLLRLAVPRRGNDRGLRRQGVGHQPRAADLGCRALHRRPQVHKYMKIVTWQRATREGAKPVAEATARISRLEGMEGHARTADIRLRNISPTRTSI
jgi:sulfopropanediol 3-dehydrogenase